MSSLRRQPDEDLRKRVSAYPGSLTFHDLIRKNKRQSVIDCFVRDLSNTGAKLMVGDLVAVPKNFTLTFHDGTAHEPAMNALSHGRRSPSRLRPAASPTRTPRARSENASARSH